MEELESERRKRFFGDRHDTRPLPPTALQTARSATLEAEVENKRLLEETTKQLATKNRECDEQSEQLKEKSEQLAATTEQLAVENRELQAQKRHAEELHKCLEEVTKQVNKEGPHLNETKPQHRTIQATHSCLQKEVTGLEATERKVRSVTVPNYRREHDADHRDRTELQVYPPYPTNKNVSCDACNRRFDTRTHQQANKECGRQGFSCNEGQPRGMWHSGFHCDRCWDRTFPDYRRPTAVAAAE